MRTTRPKVLLGQTSGSANKWQAGTQAPQFLKRLLFTRVLATVQSMAKQSNRPRWLRWLKWVILIGVLIGLALMLRGVVRDLQTSKLDFRQIRWEWITAAGFLYALGTLPGAFYWHQVLVALGQRPTIGRSLRAYFFSQLGKYVPGKAMVVVMRTMLVAGPGVRAPIAVTAVFIETLTWMAVGATTGSLMVAWLNPQHTWLVVTGIAVAIGAIVPMSPPVLRYALTRISKVTGGSRKEPDIRGLGALVIARGWLQMAVGWTLVAASMWAVLKAIPGPDANGSHFAVALECVTLSIVLGFASLIPGGLGVRELVIVPLLSPDFGAPKALACAIVVRLVWLIVEVSLVGIIQWSGKGRAR